MKMKNVQYKGKKYVGASKKGKVLVSCESTAPGQLIKVGIYDAETGSWDNNSVPKEIRSEFEKIAVKKPDKADKQKKSAEKHYTLK